VTERQFMAMVIRLARLLGWMSFHARPALTAKGWRTAVEGDGKGFPDLVLLRGRKMIVAELKVGKSPVMPEQDAWLEAFAAAGARACVWRPEQWDEIERTLTDGF